MKYILSTFLVFVLANVNAQSKKNLTYTVALKPQSGTVQVTLDFNAGSETSTVIQLPKEFGNFFNAYRHIRIQKGINIESISISTADSSVVTLNHKSKQKISFEYTIKNSLIDSLPGKQSAYSFTIKSRYFQAIGSIFFAYPKSDSLNIVNIKINWKNYPKGWSNINSFGNNYAVQTLPDIPMTLFLNSIWCGGDYRVYQFTVNKKPVYFAIRGKWRFKDADMLALVQKTIATQRAFWNDYNITQYTVTLCPFLTQDQYSYSYQGTGLTNSFATWATNNRQTNPASFSYLYNHELMHHWIGNIIENEQPEELMYWFSEGFTDYFTWRNMLESKFISQEQYNQSFDSVLAVHYSEPLHESANSSIKDGFWNNSLFQKLPYNRGRIFAFYLDSKIKKETAGKKDLKAVMVQLLKICLTDGKKINNQLLIQTVKNIAGLDITAQVQKYITEGGFIPLEEWNIAAPNTFTFKDVPVFTYGFTTDKGGLSLNAQITAVDSASNAAVAGVKSGDILKGYNITNNPAEKGEITVQRANELLKIFFYPSKKLKLLQLK